MYITSDAKETRRDLPPPHWSPTGNSGTWHRDGDGGSWKWVDDENIGLQPKRKKAKKNWFKKLIERIR